MFVITEDSYNLIKNKLSFYYLKPFICPVFQMVYINVKTPFILTWITKC